MNNTSHKKRSVLLLLPRQFVKILGGEMKDTDVVKEMQYVFENFDANSDGVITTNDLGVIMRSLGENPSEEELKEMIREADPDGSGSVEIDEFTTLMRNSS